ncbi:MAG: hypothetical protein CVT66_08090 [Actinobacteria bacterium HGW-Actinobacteria-6]|jgi:pseudouridine kinase|nr:MAG: hypothetical protein CVT66_08090 [Actinobacteria bacterium HGW-Actinobacteria-6]
MGGSVTVIGGANTDILAFSENTIVPRDSNPGHVRTSPGGVGRNIAENLARLGVETRFVTAPGEGPEADEIVRSCTDSGIQLLAVPSPGLPAPRYLAIMDDLGDLALAVNDMRALDAVTPESVEVYADLIDESSVIVLDTNVPEATLVYVAERWSDRPIMLDTVSVAKGPRARSILGALHTLKANEIEAAELAGTIAGATDAAVDALLIAGVDRLVVTGGIAGALFASGESRFRFVPPPATVVNATGAGDAYMAGLVYAELEGLDSAHVPAFASAMAALTLGSERTVSEDINVNRVLELMEGMLS